MWKKSAGSARADTQRHVLETIHSTEISPLKIPPRWSRTSSHTHKLRYFINFWEYLGGFYRPTSFFFLLKYSKSLLKVLFFRISLNMPCGETNRLVLQSVTSTALFKNSTILNSHNRSFSKFLTKILLSGIPCCALRCWIFLKRSNISLIKKMKMSSKIQSYNFRTWSLSTTSTG